MSYLNDPNTHRLATNCCLCGKALRDAVSVEIGIGPVCRNNAGYADGPAEHRTEVNKLIHRAGCSAEEGAVKAVLNAAVEIEELGFNKVALTIRERFILLKVWRDEAAPVTRWNRATKTEEIIEGRTRRAICVKTPFSKTANGNRREFIGGATRPVRGTKRGDFHWEFDHDQQRNLYAWLAKNWGGKQALSLADDGGTVFTIPTWQAFQRQYIKRAGRWVLR